MYISTMLSLKFSTITSLLSVWIAFIFFRLLWCTLFERLRSCFSESFEPQTTDILDIYKTVDLPALDDSQRRALARDALQVKRLNDLNTLRNLGTKVPVDCYNAKDKQYDTANCRQLRNQREAEIDTYVKQAALEFCKSNAKCSVPQRDKFVRDTFAAKCSAVSGNNQKRQALLSSIIKKDSSNNVFVPVLNTKAATPCLRPINTMSFNDSKDISSSAQTPPVAQQAASILIDGKTATYCSDYKIDVDDHLAQPGATILLRKAGSQQRRYPERNP